MDPALWAMLIARVGIPAAEYITDRMARRNDPITSADWDAVKSLKSANELFEEATGNPAPGN